MGETLVVPQVQPAEAPAAPSVLKPTMEQLEANCRVSQNWIRAIKRGTFQGGDAMDIATLSDFLVRSNETAIQEFEAAKLIHPEWGHKGKK